MKSSLLWIWIVLSTFMVSPLYATDDTGEINLYELNYQLNYGFPPYDSRLPVDFTWVIERYDLDRIERYVDEYYEIYHRYFVSTPREFAGKFGLSDIFFKPNLRRYENTKLIFTKNLWNNRVTLRYLAPVGDMGDFELFVAFRPHQAVKLTVRNRLNGESSIAVTVSQPLGSERKNKSIVKQTKEILTKVTGTKM